MSQIVYDVDSHMTHTNGRRKGIDMRTYMRKWVTLEVVDCQIHCGDLRHAQTRRVPVDIWLPANGFMYFAFMRVQCVMAMVLVDVIPASQDIYPSELCFDRARIKDL
jgi:hypothetical protein